jgi:hypothetical protein
MDLQGFIAFLNLPFARILLGFFFLVVVGQSYAIEKLYTDSFDNKDEIVECEKRLMQETKRINDEMKSTLRGIIEAQKKEIEKNEKNKEQIFEQNKKALEMNSELTKIKNANHI